MVNKTTPIIALLLLLLSACGTAGEKSPPSDPLLRTHVYHDLKFEARFKPSEDAQPSSSLVHAASLSGEQGKALSFELRIAPKEECGGDIMLRGVRSMEDYTARMMELNFYLDEALYLQLDGKKVPPRLVHMENTYGLSNYRIVQIAFAGAEVDRLCAEAADIDLVFRDPVFDTGISHFVFDGKEIAKAQH